MKTNNISPKFENRMWRTLVRFERVIEDQGFFVLPSWDHEKLLSLPLKDLPGWIQLCLKKKPVFRCHVQCNTGTSEASRLRFENWEE